MLDKVHDEIACVHEVLTKSELGHLKGGPFKPPEGRAFLKWTWPDHRNFGFKYLLVWRATGTNNFNVIYSNDPSVFMMEVELAQAVDTKTVDESPKDSE